MTNATNTAMSAAIVNSVIAAVQSGKKAETLYNATAKLMHDAGLGRASFIGKGAPHRAQLVDAIHLAWIGKAGIEKIAKAKKAGKKAEEITVKSLKASGAETLTARQITTQTPKAIERIVKAIEAIDKPKAETERGTNKNRTGMSALAHNTATIYGKARKLAMSNVEEMTKSEQAMAANWPAKQRQEFAAALKTALKLIPADIRKAEGIKVS